MQYTNDIRKWKCNKKEFLFFLAYSVLIIYRILKSTTLGLNDYGIAYLIVTFLLVCRVLTMRMKVNSLFFLACLCPIVFICVLKTWDPIIPLVVMMLIASKDVDFDRIVKISFNIVATMVMITVLLTIIGLLADTTSYRVFNGKSVICHGAGFNHSSALPTYYCFLFLEYMYLKKRKISIIKLILWMLGGMIIFSFCVERLRFALLLIACILMCVSKLFECDKFQHIKKYISILIYPVLCIITVGLGYFYNPLNPIMYDLNITLSNRLYYEHYTFNHFGITMFGQSMEMGTDVLKINGNLEYYYLDAGYVYIFAIYGIIIGLLILTVYMVGIYKASKLSRSILWIWFICMAIDSLVGNQMLSLWICPLLFVPFCKVNGIMRK